MEKVRCLRLSDPNTPILGALSAQAILICGEVKAVERLEYMRPWSYCDDYEAQYPNRSADWMYDLVKTQMPEFDHASFTRWLKCVYRPDDFLRPPLFMAPSHVERVPAAMVVDGDVVGQVNEGAPTGFGLERLDLGGAK